MDVALSDNRYSAADFTAFRTVQTRLNEVTIELQALLLELEIRALGEPPSDQVSITATSEPVDQAGLTRIQTLICETDALVAESRKLVAIAEAQLRRPAEELVSVVHG